MAGLWRTALPTMRRGFAVKFFVIGGQDYQHQIRILPGGEKAAG